MIGLGAALWLLPSDKRILGIGGGGTTGAASICGRASMKVGMGGLISATGICIVIRGSDSSAGLKITSASLSSAHLTSWSTYGELQRLKVDQESTMNKPRLVKGEV